MLRCEPGRKQPLLPLQPGGKVSATRRALKAAARQGARRAYIHWSTRRKGSKHSDFSMMNQRVHEQIRTILPEAEQQKSRFFNII